MIPLLLLTALSFDSTVVKDLKKVCQIAAPADFKLDPNFPGLAKGPGDAVEVAVFSSPGAVKPIMESVAKMMGIDRFIDNTATRVFYVAKPLTGRDGKTTVQWTVKIPRPPGQCFANITVVNGGQEDLVKKIAATIAVVP
jgi:hypothetical protein